MSTSFGPRPKGSLVFPYKAGRSSWEGVSDGTTLRLRIEPTVPRTGETLRIFVEAHHPERPICGQSVLIGDGSGQRPETQAAAAELTRVFNRPGRFEFLYQAIVGVCGDHNLYPSMYGWLDVAAGAGPTSQGPALPTVEALEQRAPNEPAGTGTLKAWAKGRDADGYIHRFLIDWGDGSPVEEAPNVAYGFDGGCEAGPSGWPVRPEAWTNYQQPPTHTYAAPGDYTVTITAVSAGCAGRDEQRATATFAYRW